MKKQTKVLAAATLLTLGASFSSMAALKNGTWVQNEDGWQYIDKDGEYVESEWCYSNGVEYWINDEGFLGANEWVNEGNYSYYVDEYGRKSIDKWQYIYGEDEEDADEESWFYFDQKGKMISNQKKEIGDNTYYFGKDGKMLTGWVEYHKDNNVPQEDGTVKDVTTVKTADDKTTVEQVVFCNEDGALVKSAWLNEFPWSEDANELYEGDDEEWYYAKSNGSLATKKQDDVNGQTYFFDETTGVMMEGWVIKVKEGKKVHYVAVEESFTADGAVEVYFATEDGDGHAKKNGWKELENPDGDVHWYYFDKVGRAFLGRASDSNAQPMAFDSEDLKDEDTLADAVITDGAAFSVSEKRMNGVSYYFNQEGEMLDGLVKINNKLMYLEDGAAQTGKVSLTDEYSQDDYTFCFADKTNKTEGYQKFVAVTGNKDGYCYENGVLMTSSESGVYELIETDAGDFIVDYRGKIMHNDSKEYFNENETFKFVTTKGVSKYSIAK